MSGTGSFSSDSFDHPRFYQYVANDDVWIYSAYLPHPFTAEDLKSSLPSAATAKSISSDPLLGQK
jgi:hypothetical protein